MEDNRPFLERGQSFRNSPETSAQRVASVSRPLILVTCLASVGGLMFGYDTACVSGTLYLLGDDFGAPLKETQQELITSITSFGALIGSILSGCANCGRKPLMALACIFFTGASIVMATSQSYMVLVAGRFSVGLGVGAAASVVPVYLTEVAPARLRASVNTVNSCATTFGQVLAYVCSIIFAKLPHGWRWVLGAGALPSFVFLVLVPFFPESPRYLTSKSKKADARKVMRLLEPSLSDEDIYVTIKTISLEIASTKQATRISSLFTRRNFRAAVISCGLMSLQQLCGFNTLMYYSALIFGALGFKNPLLVSLVVAITNCVFTVVALFLIDRVGRRRMLLSTVWIMVISLVVLGFSFKYAQRNTYAAVTSVISTIAFVASYATAMGAIPWQSVDFFTVQQRSVAGMLISSTNWTCNMVVSATFLSLVKAITGTGAFIVYAAITTIGYCGIYLFYPETSRLGLEEVPALFDNRFTDIVSEAKKVNVIE